MGRRTDRGMDSRFTENRFTEKDGQMDRQTERQEFVSHGDQVVSQEVVTSCVHLALIKLGRR